MRLVLAPLNPTIGDLAGNCALVSAAAEHARSVRADVLLCPELVLSGYPPRDLLQQEGFVGACADAAGKLGASASHGLTLIFGTPLPADRGNPAAGTANSLVVYRDGALIDFYDKRLLPTYDVFDEDRYFVPGQRSVVVLGGGAKLGLTICEDLWRGEDAGFASRYLDAPDPIAPLIAGGATALLSASASPFVLGKGQKHRDILAAHARRHRVHVASVNQLGGNDDLVFDGHTCVVGPDGSMVASGELFRGAPLVVDLPGPAGEVRHDAPQERLLFDALVLGIRDYLRKTGFTKAIIGLSGGIDSALTAALAAAALGAENVLGVAMPSRYSSGHSVEDAYDLSRRLGSDCRTISIEQPMAGLGGELNSAFTVLGQPRLGEKLPDLTEENLQSRIRGTILMALSNRSGAIVLTTGNKSELGVGYCTLYGDMNGGLAVLSDVSKQWVYRLSRWINTNAAACGFRAAPIPERSIEKAPSAELRPNQTDQDSLPPYEVLDEILERYVERRQSAARIVRETGFAEATVRRIARLVHVAEFKRKQAALGLKMTTVAYGSGRRWPIAQRYPVV